MVKLDVAYRDTINEDNVNVWNIFIEFVKQLLVNCKTLLLITWPLLLPIAAFVCFVVQNGGIVVGMLIFMYIIKYIRCV